nr:hypothetical protein CFP56_60783 [Quercus suber]
MCVRSGCRHCVKYGFQARRPASGNNPSGSSSMGGSVRSPSRLTGPDFPKEKGSVDEDEARARQPICRCRLSRALRLFISPRSICQNLLRQKIQPVCSASATSSCRDAQLSRELVLEALEI